MKDSTMRGKAKWLHSVGLAAALPLAAGCAQILSLHDRADRPGTDGGTMTGAGGNADGGSDAPVSVVTEGQCGMLKHPSAACAACMDQSCCDEASACAGDAACQESVDCLVTCTDATCRARCAEFYTHPETLIKLRTCRVAHCAAECGSSCGEFASSIPGCQDCEETNCCAQGVECAQNLKCALLAECHNQCAGSTDCPSNCDKQYPEGTADYQAYSHCSDGCNASSCRSGQDWACLDRSMPWPRPAGAGMITFSLSAVDFIDENPFVGSTVKACSKFDLNCDMPLSTGTTDPSGTVTLTVPQGASGFDGYLDITGGLNNGDSIFPAIWYPRPFVVADGWRGKVTFVSNGQFMLLGLATSTTIDPKYGHFAANATDCSFSPAAGVSFAVDTMDDKTKSFYFVGGVPLTTATMTDASAGGGFVNLPTQDTAKLVLVTATSSIAGGRTMGKQSFVIRPGRFTYSSFPPVP
jgi:hypothetical protein